MVVRHAKTGAGLDASARPAGDALVWTRAGTRNGAGRGQHGLLRAGARCAAVRGAPETRWQAGRLPQVARRKLLYINELCRWRQPANHPSQLAGWQAGWQAAVPFASLNGCVVCRDGRRGAAVYRFDRMLIDPTPKALSQALAEASAAANKGFRARLLSWPPDDFTAFVTAWRAAPEGQRQWNAPGIFRKKGYAGDTRSAAAVVWWSDPLHRKHCRVVAERIECAGPMETGLFEPERYKRYPERPVLWRVYPDDLYLREQADKWQLWAGCRCGASGTPEELGWMGPWCAACHDRAEEGTPLT